MKVAIVTYFPEDPSAPRGGVEAVSVNLTRALSGFKDLDLHVVTFNGHCSSVSKSSWDGITIHRLPAPKGSVLLSAIGPGRRSVSEYLCKLSPDVVHAHDTYGLMVKGLRIPRVFTIHGFIYGDTLVSRQRWPRLRSWIWRRFETSGWADQPHIISISPYVRERLTGIATGVIHDIDNPISESFFHIERKEKEGIIFSAGVISRRKNTLALIEAYAILMGKGIKAELRLAGDVTEPRYGKLVEDCINKYNLKDKVKLLGRLTTQKIAQELESATLFALVSLEENSPMGIEEAMAAGIPVVTSNRCGMPYMVRHGESGFLVNPKDPCDIARRLGQILSEPTLKKSMADRSKAIALERFHPRRVAQRTLEVYYEAIQRKSDNPPEEKCLGGDDRRSP